MQRIEKYAVIALVLLLVTILAVSLWSQKKGKSPFSFFKKGNASGETAQLSGADPVAGGGFETTGIGEQPQTGLAPLGAQNVNDPTLPADWKPGDPWVNRGRIANQTQPVDASGATGTPGTTPAVYQQPLVGSQQPTAGFVSEAPAPRVETPTHTPTKSKSLAAGPTYVVRSGDTLGEIAARELGSFDKWSEISALNGNLDPKKLQKGMKIVLPAGAKSASKPTAGSTAVKSSVAPGGEYVVQKGDTLSGIAQKVLGKGARWTEIASLNPSINPERLVVGARLRLPKGVAAGSQNVAKADRSRNRVR